MAVFSTKIPNLGGMRAEKIRKKVDGGQVVRGSGQVVRDGGQGCRRDGEGMAAAVLAGWLVRNKSKTICAPRFMVLFYVQSNLFCTDAEFAPMAAAGSVPAAVRLEGSQAGRWRGDTPLFTCIVGTISRFGLQKFFFGFRVGWAVSIG